MKRKIKGIVTKFQAGFSLIELLLYMGIISILITLLTTVFFSILDSQQETEATSAADQNGRYVISRFIYDISRAQSIGIPSADGGQSNSLQISINSINYTYSLDSDGNLQIANTNGTDNLNGYDATVSGLSFQRLTSNDGKKSIKLSFTITSKTQQERGPQVRSLQTTIGIR